MARLVRSSLSDKANFPRTPPHSGGAPGFRDDIKDADYDTMLAKAIEWGAGALSQWWQAVGQRRLEAAYLVAARQAEVFPNGVAVMSRRND
jgi:hypothetical protein